MRTRKQNESIAKLVRAFIETAIRHSSLPATKNLERFDEELTAFCVSVQDQANAKVKAATEDLRDRCAQAALTGLMGNFVESISGEGDAGYTETLNRYVDIAYDAAGVMLQRREKKE